LSRLPVTRKGEKFIDVGCEPGASTIGAARRGYEALGLSWDKRNHRIAGRRAARCNGALARFEIQDIRCLHERRELVDAFDVAICFETIEHVLDPDKLTDAMVDDLSLVDVVC
jgi:2-polyprenyl-3-methyl-5-hydroxy-6-metoxy-1,4-benzoquinol methylase